MSLEENDRREQAKCGRGSSAHASRRTGKILTVHANVLITVEVSASLTEEAREPVQHILQLSIGNASNQNF